MSPERKNILGSKFKKAGASGLKAHIISRQGRWVVFKEGSSKASAIYDSRRSAFFNAKKMMNAGDADVIVLHKKDGSVDRIQTAG